ncbi:MAG TPA: hypothetical protein VHW09_03575 [Bryobacteraceae bacterium]|jgi:hypothetical protein|nr:hypothetical protein [Bryobacteraceae bacterium]
MPLKAQDLQNYEAYKKATHAAASQIKKDTPFCLYSDVEIPDASKKMHTLRPFLVVGSPANAVTPLLKDLHGGKKPTASGLCSLDNGKISFVAKSGKVEYNLLKSQATLFKELLGKEIMMPGAGGGAAVAAAKPAGPVATVKTPYGALSYFSTDSANASVIKTIEKAVENIEGAEDDVKSMDAAYKESEQLKKKVPSTRDIMDWVKKADRASSDEARQAKAAFLIFDEIRGKMEEVNEDFENAGKGVSSALKDMQAEDLEEKAKELKKQAQEEAEMIEGAFKLFTIAFKAGKALADPASALDLVDDAAEGLGKAISYMATSGLLQQAADCEAQAHELKVEAIAVRLGQAKQHLTDLAKRQTDTLGLLKRAKELIQTTGSAPMKGFDKNTKGPFKFQDLQAYADRLAECCDLARDAIKEAKQAFDIADVVMAPLGSGKWKVPHPDDAKKILQQMKDEAVKLGKHAGDTYKGANMMRIESQKTYAAAQDALSKANS